MFQPSAVSFGIKVASVKVTGKTVLRQKPDIVNKSEELRKETSKVLSEFFNIPQTIKQALNNSDKARSIDRFKKENGYFFKGQAFVSSKSGESLFDGVLISKTKKGVYRVLEYSNGNITCAIKFNPKDPNDSYQKIYDTFSKNIWKSRLTKRGDNAGINKDFLRTKFLTSTHYKSESSKGITYTTIDYDGTMTVTKTDPNGEPIGRPKIYKCPPN